MVVVALAIAACQGSLHDVGKGDSRLIATLGVHCRVEGSLKDTPYAALPVCELLVVGELFAGGHYVSPDLAALPDGSNAEPEDAFAKLLQAVHDLSLL